MIITGFNNINIYKKYNNSTDKPIFSGQISNTVDIFTRSQDGILQKAFSKLRKINISEYKSLTDLEKQVLRQEIAKIKNLNTKVEVLKEDIKIHQFITETIIKAFDIEYGRGKYVIIPIGRSLSSIGKLLEFKIGEDSVKNIPLSNLSIFDPKQHNQVDQWSKIADVEAYKRYLASIGLSREKIENSNKQYIIMDYVFSGKSLKNAYKILTSDTFFGNKMRNITFVSTQEILPQNHSKEKGTLAVDLQRSAFKLYSYVDKINIINEVTIQRCVDYNKFSMSEESVKLRKLFGFGLMDSKFDSKAAKEFQDIVFQSDVRCFPGQNKCFWNSAIEQFKKDLYIDDYEIAKALLRHQNNPEIVNLLNNFKYIVEPQPMNYYGIIRPKLLEILNIANK